MNFLNKKFFGIKHIVFKFNGKRGFASAHSANKAALEKKWKERLGNFKNDWKKVADDNAQQQIEEITKSLGHARVEYIKAVAEAYANMNNYQKMYVDGKIKENLIKTKNLSAIDVNTDWVSLAQNDEDVPPVNPEFFKQQEIMSKFTEWLKTQEGINLGFSTGAAVEAAPKKEEAKAEVKEEKKVEKEKEIFDVYLTGYDASKKITIIKEVRALTNLGLKESKELVEALPAKILTKVKKDELKPIVDKLEAAGAKLELK